MNNDPDARTNPAYTEDPKNKIEVNRGRTSSQTSNTDNASVSWSDRSGIRRAPQDNTERKRSRSVSIDRGIQSQKEGEEAVNIIKNSSNGIGLWAFLRVMHRQPGFMVDIKEIARYIQLEEARSSNKNCKTHSSIPIQQKNEPEISKTQPTAPNYLTITPQSLLTTTQQQTNTKSYNPYMKSIWDTPPDRHDQKNATQMQQKTSTWANGCILSLIHI